MPKSGESNHNAKLSTKQVREIVRAWVDGEATVPELCERYNLSSRTLRQWLDGISRYRELADILKRRNAITGYRGRPRTV